MVVAAIVAVRNRLQLQVLNRTSESRDSVESQYLGV